MSTGHPRLLEDVDPAGGGARATTKPGYGQSSRGRAETQLEVRTDSVDQISVPGKKNNFKMRQ